VLRRNLEALAADLAHDVLVESQQVIAELGEPGTVALVATRRRPVLLRSPYPPDAVLARAPATGTLVAAGPRLGPLGEERAFVQSHRRRFYR